MRNDAVRPIGRVTLQDPRFLYGSEARVALIDALTTAWPGEVRVRFLATPAGFLQVEFPEDWEDYVGWDSTASAIESLYEHAEPAVTELLSGPVGEMAARRADFLTVGVDLGTDDGPRDVHAELIAVYDTQASRVVRWLGKAYPTGPQADALVHDVHFGSHCLQVGESRVVVIACHELTAFGGRSQKNIRPGSPRHGRSQQMLRVISELRPTVILHHSHVTQRHRTWSQGWSGLLKSAAPAAVWATSLRYLPSGRGEGLDLVLEKTAGGSAVLDVVLPPPTAESS